MAQLTRSPSNPVRLKGCRAASVQRQLSEWHWVTATGPTPAALPPAGLASAGSAEPPRIPRPRPPQPRRTESRPDENRVGAFPYRANPFGSYIRPLHAKSSRRQRSNSPRARQSSCLTSTVDPSSKCRPDRSRWSAGDAVLEYERVVVKGADGRVLPTWRKLTSCGGHGLRTI